MLYEVITQIESFTGGGATNTALSFKKQGIDVACFCHVGNDTPGQKIVKELELANVSIEHVKTMPNQQTGTSFMVNAITKERTIFTFRGTNLNLDLASIDKKIIAPYSLLYITSLPQKATQGLPQLTALAKKNNIKVAINPGSSQLKQDTLQLV